MSYAAPARKTAFPALAPKSGATVSTSLRIGETNDSFEREADRVAEEVMAGGAKWSLSSMTLGSPLQRKCSCGGSGECAECKEEKTVQRKAYGVPRSGYTPPIVDEVLSSPGRALDSETRAFFEPRFGHDFSRVRVHADARAEESARAVDAAAYTVGQDIAFAATQYAPGTDVGRRLLAHELTHVLQQESTGPSFAAPNASPVSTSKAGGTVGARDSLQRRIFPPPCLPADQCKAPIPGSASDFAQSIEDNPFNGLGGPGKPPPAPGSGRPANEFKSAINTEDPFLLVGIYDVVIDPNFPPEATAATTSCRLASPPPSDPKARCLSVPDVLDKQAKEYNAGAPTIDGLSRYSWATSTLQTVRHEQAHVEFGRDTPAGSRDTLSPDIFEYELSELNSILSEFPILFRRTMSSPSSQPSKTETIEEPKTMAIRMWLDFQIFSPYEGIAGIVKKLKCTSSCADVEIAVSQVFDYQSKNWTEEEKQFYLQEITEANIGWPAPAKKASPPPSSSFLPKGAS